MKDLIFYDGTPYMQLVRTLKTYSDKVDIRHDVDERGYVPQLLKLAELEVRRGWKTTYFLFPEMMHLEKKFTKRGAHVGVHCRIKDLDICPKATTSLHGDPCMYCMLPLPAASSNMWSYLEPWDLYISDSMRMWSTCVRPGKIWEHELFEDPRRKGLPEALIYCFRNKPDRVQILVHGDPITWRAI